MNMIFMVSEYMNGGCFQNFSNTTVPDCTFPRGVIISLNYDYIYAIYSFDALMRMRLWDYPALHFVIHSHSRVFNNGYNTHPNLSVKLSIYSLELIGTIYFCG